jgi:hypothetical protein
MRKSLTPEQKAACEERKAKFKDLWKQVADMPEAERLQLSARLGIVTPDGHALSVHNQCLVSFQRQTATVVGGFRQWLKQGRCVKKGEHGMMIWVPIRRKVEALETEEPEEPESETEGKPTGTRFIIGTVFDIAQTEEKTDAPNGSAGAIDLENVVFAPVPAVESPAPVVTPVTPVPVIPLVPASRPAWRRAA